MRTRALLLSLLLTIVAFISTAGWAGNVPRKTRPANKITDAAGRTHVRPTTSRITDAQRKAAAQRRKAIRAKNGRRTNPVRPTTPGQVR